MSFNSMGWNNNQKTHQNQHTPFSEYSKSVDILLSFETRFWEQCCTWTVSLLTALRVHSSLNTQGCLKLGGRGGSSPSLSFPLSSSLSHFCVSVQKALGSTSEARELWPKFSGVEGGFYGWRTLRSGEWHSRKLKLSADTFFYVHSVELTSSRHSQRRTT